MPLMTEEPRFDFDDEARKVLTSTQEEAQRMRRQHIEGLHMLLALYRHFEYQGTASKVFGQTLGDIAALRALGERRLGPAPRFSRGEMPLAAELRGVLDEAIARARLKNGSMVTPTILLSALLRQSESVRRFLSELGCDIDQIQAAVDENAG